MSRSELGYLGAIALQEKRKILNGTCETVPPQSSFFFEGGLIRHGRCRKPLSLKGTSNATGLGTEALLYCGNCKESITIPVSVLEKALHLS